MIAGTRRVAGQGAVPRQAPAGHYQAGTGCLFAGRASTRRAGGGPPAGLCRALSGGHCVPDRWRSADSAGAASPAATLWSQDRVSCQGRTGRQSEEGQRASQRAASPGSGIERPVTSGRHGVLTCRGPVNRVAQWQVPGRLGTSTAPARPPTRHNGTRISRPRPGRRNPNRREDDAADLRAVSVHLKGPLFMTPNPAIFPDFVKVPRLLSAHFFSPAASHPHAAPLPHPVLGTDL